ncbi:hypothetical protein [Methanobacterium aggregans]|uniref:hypothetical protein n=1 Tax=Methanobacterium aggregans TaxID=1615586 RepID=UPI001AEA76A3|nr:hypothetical protein [Methanobacterium aggregans]MBP2045371.1 hypothetical protein [Methanobacterium aggregans]
MWSYRFTYSNIEINGSSEVPINKVTKSFEGVINGFGDIKINSGEIGKAKIYGSGTINVNIKVDKAELIQCGSGNIFVKHVTESSIEPHQDQGPLMLVQWVKFNVFFIFCF